MQTETQNSVQSLARAQRFAQDPQAQECLTHTREYLQQAVQQVRETLAGRADWGGGEQRALCATLAELDPFLRQPELVAEPFFESPALQAISQELQTYAQNLQELQQELERLRCVLLVRTTALRARQQQVQGLARWSAAWQQTR